MPGFSHTMFTREINAKTAESEITVVCKPLAANSFARICPWYLIAHTVDIKWSYEIFKQVS